MPCPDDTGRQFFHRHAPQDRTIQPCQEGDPLCAKPYSRKAKNMDEQDSDSPSLPTWNDPPVDITITDEDGDPIYSLADDPEIREKVFKVLLARKYQMLINPLKRGRKP